MMKPDKLSLGLRLVDGWVILITLALSYILRQRFLIFWYDPIQPWWVYVWLGLGAWTALNLIGSLKGLYSWSKVFSQRQSLYLWRVWESTFILGLIITSGSYFAKYDFSRIVVGVWWLMLLMVLPMVHLWLSRYLSKIFTYHILMVGKNRLSLRFIKNLRLNADLKISTTNKLPDRVLDCDEVVIIDPSLGRDEVFNWLTKKADRFKRVSLALNFFPHIFTDPQLRLDYEDLPRLSFKHPSVFYVLVKRALDIGVGLLMIVITAPVMIVIGLFIWMKTGRRPIIKLTRVGYRGRKFGMYKFVTMKGKPRADKSPTTPDDSRLYSWGRWLRRTSLDELPQLFNVIKGQMSLIGPRPEMMMEVKNYKPWQRMRLRVKPGLTGLWQVLGRKDLPLSKNLQYDLYYIANQSLWLDFWILLKTPWVILTGRGAY